MRLRKMKARWWMCYRSARGHERRGGSNPCHQLLGGGQCRPLVAAFRHRRGILPAVLVGFVLLMLLGRRGPVGALLADAGIQFAFTAKGAALATAVMIFPVFVRSIRLAFEATDRGLFEAAAVLRAGPL